ncbi:MAG: alginate export family protein [Verrucomicrobia bacterium]|nr:alginate export family protein [Verrucomicrobiota bacterium]
MKTKSKTLISATLALTSLGGSNAQEAAVPEKAAPPKSSFFTGEIPQAFKDGTISVNTWLRYENVNQTGLKDANALLIRPRLGFTTAPLYGFQGMVEMENVTAIGTSRDYNAAGTNLPGGAGHAVIADPETTQLNQAWLSYTHWDTTLKLGRQVIVRNNHRWVGDVPWRMNNQTFDAATLANTTLKDLTVSYGYVWNVNRIFGDEPGLSAANQDFRSRSHLINLDYTGFSFGKLGTYAYLLDLDNGAGAVSDANDSASYGVSLSGAVPVSEKFKLDYAAEFAWQTDYADNPLAGGYEAPYYKLEVKVPVKPVTLGVGYEVLGSDNGKGLSTPLATLHAFNGWADQFLSTPGGGIRDLYASAGVSLPFGFKTTAIYHNLTSDSGGLDYGDEIDLLLTKSFGKHWSGLVKYASFDGKDSPTARDVKKFWTQIEFKY